MIRPDKKTFVVLNFEIQKRFKRFSFSKIKFLELGYPVFEILRTPFSGYPGFPRHDGISPGVQRPRVISDTQHKCRTGVDCLHLVTCASSPGTLVSL